MFLSDDERGKRLPEFLELVSYALAAERTGRGAPHGTDEDATHQRASSSGVPPGVGRFNVRACSSDARLVSEVRPAGRVSLDDLIDELSRVTLPSSARWRPRDRKRDAAADARALADRVKRELGIVSVAERAERARPPATRCNRSGASEVAGRAADRRL